MIIYVLQSPTGGYGVDVNGLSLICPDAGLYSSYELPILGDINEAIEALDVCRLAIEKLLSGEISFEMARGGKLPMVLNTINRALSKSKSTD